MDVSNQSCVSYVYTIHNPTYGTLLIRNMYEDTYRTHSMYSYYVCINNIILMYIRMYVYTQVHAYVHVYICY